MSLGVPVESSGRVDPHGRRPESGSQSRRNKGGDFSTRTSRTDSSLPRVGHLELERIREELSDRDSAVVRLVGEFRLVSARQLRRLFFPDSDFATPETAARCSRRVLKRLVLGRLLARLERRVGGTRAGSNGYVYTLGPVGHRLVHPAGRSRPRHFEPSTAFVDHQLAVGELVVDLRLAERRSAIEVLAVQGEPRSWRRLPGQRVRAGLLRPDLHVRLRAREIELSWFVEVDRGTAHVPALLRKCVLYESYYQSGTEQAEHGVFPRVLWVVPTDGRLARLTSAIGRSRQLTEALFAVTTADRALDVLCGAEVAQ